MGLPTSVEWWSESATRTWEKSEALHTLTRAYRPGCNQPLPPGEYVCRRCGAQREYNVAREKPTHCSDCKYVLDYREPEPRKPPRQHPTHLTDEECLAARKAFRHGDRTPEVEAAAREYWRRQAIKARARRQA